MKVKRQKLDHAEEQDEKEEGAEAMSSQAIISQPKLSYEDRLQFVTAIAKPMATRKVAKKLFKLVKKSSKVKKHLVCGLKAVQLQLRKGARGIVLLAGDITPIDIMCHMPAVCEELNIPYAYVPSKNDLGEARGMTRPLILVMILEHEDYKDLFAECKTEIGKLPSPLP